MSGTTGYFPNPSEIAVADIWHGPYRVLGNPHPADQNQTSWHSQIVSVFKVAGKKDLYIAVADRWLPEAMDKEYGVYKQIFRDMFQNNGKEFDYDLIGGPVIENTSISEYVWLPLRFDGEMVYIDWKDEWRIEEYE